MNKELTVRNNSINCRICNDGNGCIAIFNNLIYPNIPNEIKNISGVTICESKTLSNYMCQSCFDLLNGCIVFRELCLKSSMQMIQITLKTDNIADKDVKEESHHVESEDSDHIPTPSYSEDETEPWAYPSSKEKQSKAAVLSNNQLKETDEIPTKGTNTQQVTKKKFLCDTCGKIAPSYAGLLVHMSTHENVFPYKCDVCPYQGRTMDLLKVHKRSHLVDKPFKCSQCPKAATTASNLAKHVRHVHSTTRPYKCTYCDKAFSYQHDMKRHIKDIHLRQGTVQCDVCLKKYNTKKILQGHRFKVHKIKAERQGRLPSYLQCQMDDTSENNTTVDDEPSYIDKL